MSDICRKLHLLAHQKPVLSFPFDRKIIPANGIYVLFEADEHSHGGLRIVRIGTHTGDNQLHSRLTQHFLMENKDRSIFRKNIGRALLNKGNDPFLEQWEIDLTTKKAKQKYAATINAARQREVEFQVTNFIQSNFSFVVFPIDDGAGRLEIESKMISTVSLCEECGPSAHWLGLHSPKAKIRDSGMWVINELYKTPLTEADLDKLLK